MTSDALGRPLRSLRISVTDRCNLRCRYCMPEESYEWLPRDDLLTFEEIARLAGVFASLGVDRVRLTGGEPLLRAQLPALVEQLAADARIRDLAITTNGVLLAEQAVALRHAGMHRVTVSLDTLRADRFEALTRRDLHSRVMSGIASLTAAGFTGTKLDSVVIRGQNDDELADLVDFARSIGAEVRFIEYMDVGGATHWSIDQVVSRDEILARLTERFGAITPVRGDSSAPAERYRLADGTVFGIIASTTTPFCRTCDRSRLTADGLWYLCLYAPIGTDLRGPLRAGASDAELAQIVRSIWNARRDRGAEERAMLPERQTLVGIERLRRDPHLEMHTRGG
ncbi:MAG TPA: GTP 3',8-cyclase MoaA [Gemmatimonadaceae bacterium]|jgi:cyclic pyranopterin phosphate synthase